MIHSACLLICYALGTAIVLLLSLDTREFWALLRDTRWLRPDRCCTTVIRHSILLVYPQQHKLSWDIALTRVVHVVVARLHMERRRGF